LGEISKVERRKEYSKMVKQSSEKEESKRDNRKQRPGNCDFVAGEVRNW
jgi:hypothetical protein